MKLSIFVPLMLLFFTVFITLVAWVSATNHCQRFGEETDLTVKHDSSGCYAEVSPDVWVPKDNIVYTLGER